MTDTKIELYSEEISSEIIDGEAMIINLENGRYYSLDGAGMVIWQEILNGSSATAIKRTCADRYDADGASIDQAVDALVAELESEQLVTCASADIPSPAETSSKPGQDKTPFKPPKLNIYTDMEELLLLDPIHDIDTQGWPNINTEKQ